MGTVLYSTSFYCSTRTFVYKDLGSDSDQELYACNKTCTRIDNIDFWDPLSTEDKTETSTPMLSHMSYKCQVQEVMRLPQ